MLSEKRLIKEMQESAKGMIDNRNTNYIKCFYGGQFEAFMKCYGHGLHEYYVNAELPIKEAIENSLRRGELPPGF